MLKFNKLAILFLCNVVAGQAQAEFMKGDEFYSHLKQSVNGGLTFKSGVGFGYLMGVTDATSGIYFCPPAMSDVQSKQIVFNYMEKHPELWNVTAAISVVNAFKELYPCK